jgi:hypothetical protein
MLPVDDGRICVDQERNNPLSGDGDYGESKEFGCSLELRILLLCLCGFELDFEGPGLLLGKRIGTFADQGPGSRKQ